jgi:hypothetical protein
VTTVLAVVALIVAGCCGVGWGRSGQRVAALEARVARLEQEVHDDLVPTIDLTRRESEEAYAAARLAKHAVGIEDPPPRLAGEAVTGPVVRAVAFGAGARRAFARFAADVTPMARTRRNTVRILTTATRGRRGDKGNDKRNDNGKRHAG